VACLSCLIRQRLPASAFSSEPSRWRPAVRDVGLARLDLTGVRISPARSGRFGSLRPLAQAASTVNV